MGSTIEIQIDSLLVKKTSSTGYRKGDRKAETERGATYNILCDKNIEQ